jgi:hypothetical protein
MQHSHTHNNNDNAIHFLHQEPTFQYLKKPVQTLNELYTRYPDGGRYGWFAFVYEHRTFAWWDFIEKDWKLLNTCNCSNGNNSDIVDVSHYFSFVPEAQANASEMKIIAKKMDNVIFYKARIKFNQYWNYGSHAPIIDISNELLFEVDTMGHSQFHGALENAFGAASENNSKSTYSYNSGNSGDPYLNQYSPSNYFNDIDYANFGISDSAGNQGSHGIDKDGNAQNYSRGILPSPSNNCMFNHYLEGNQIKINFMPYTFRRHQMSFYNFTYFYCWSKSTMPDDIIEFDGYLFMSETSEIGEV